MRKPKIYKRDSRWWVNCKHGDRTGPYRDFSTAVVGAEILWKMYGPYRR